MLHWLRKHKKSCIRGFAAVSAVFGVMCGVTAKVLAAEVVSTDMITSYLWDYHCF